ncbi:MAG: PilN domain-containing protein, partial [Desulfamplus sp.]|nr:PilN domain-containing protein [Desulfamplus sp.]
QENYASAAVAPTLIKRVQQISLDDEPVKIKIIHPFRYIIISLFILIFALYFITDNINTQSIEASEELKEIVSQIKELEKELEPLQSKIDTLKKASRFKTDVEEFMQTRPPLYTAINEIAILVPDGTWFANFTFNSSGITLRGTGTDALKTVEALRSSKLFANVMLRGSVNRRPNGDESFTLAIELKNEEIDQTKDDSKKEKDEVARGDRNE